MIWRDVTENNRVNKKNKKS